MASGSDRTASQRVGPPTPASPAALLADLRAALAQGMPPAVVDALTLPLQNALTTPGSVAPAALAAALDQLEDALELVLLFPPPPPGPASATDAA